MLDTDTKRRIDTARDILVGKVPDPKSQVEQITIALIYKFMDDIDAESEEFGGKRSFFAGEYARYGWAKLMRSGLGGHETLNLYAEAITTMPENPGIPPLFRDIFNNAYLPYRDPETLRAFLKTIDEFTYDHSERLGDAFEYLLSVLGSQGDAGQFRTPRHIIDFIVGILEPKKGETVLDPACGTAGFLISSYKHILAANTDPQGASTLTPDDKGRLAANFKGYDISPDMVRLSLVNMYLHGFTDPHIFEYDTLTSEERWNEYADVILANPPFMSPKGGIRPHNRFSVKSKRSEVLFVDYMAEHLMPSGRAGIIVPEGIIFQSQNAYKQLRKMLVEEYLVAVVSLPAGVFQPYSGVKTSILILDKSLAKKSNRIAFFKIENEGFDLGAQRRPIEQNDLPQVQAEIAEFLRRLRAGESVDDFEPTQGLIVEKGKLTAEEDYNLSGERYRENGARTSQFSLVPLSEVVEILDSQRKPITKHDRKPGPYPYYGATGVLDHVEGYLFDEPLVLVGEDGAKWGSGEQSAFPVEGKIWVNNHAHVLRPRHNRLLDRFLIEVLNKADLTPYVTGVTVPKLNQGKLRNIQIPLPPLEVQKEIVAEIEGYQKVIAGARAVVDNYRPHIAINPDWPLVSIAELTELEYGFTAKAEAQGDARFIRITDISEDGTLHSKDQKFITLTDEARSFLLKKGDILVARTGATYGKTMLFEEDYPAVFASYLIRLRFLSGRVNPGYYWAFVQSNAYWHQAKALVTGGGQPQFNGHAIKKILLPLPPLELQGQIVAEIEAEQALVNANRELIDRFKKKIQDTLARVWGAAETDTAEA